MPSLVLQAGGTLDTETYDVPYAKSVALGDVVLGTYLGLSTRPHVIASGADALSDEVSPSPLQTRVQTFLANASGSITSSVTGQTAHLGINHISLHVLRPTSGILALVPSILLTRNYVRATQPIATSAVPVSRGDLVVACSRISQNCGPWNDLAAHGDQVGTALTTLLASTKASGSWYNGTYTASYALFWGLFEIAANGTFGIYAFDTTLWRLTPTYDQTPAQNTQNFLMV